MKKTVALFLIAILSLVLCSKADVAAVFGHVRLFIQNGEVAGEKWVDNVVSSARVSLQKPVKIDPPAAN